jgi:hypothetical protein
MGSFSAGDFLRPAGIEQFGELVSPAALQRLLAFLADVPGTVTHTVLLECRLGASDGPVDLSLQSLAQDSERDRFREFVDAPAQPGDWRQSEAGRTIRDFAARWIDPRSSVHHTLENAWLEFDFAANASPLPALFFHLRYPRDATRAERQHKELLDEALTPFARLSPAPRATDRLAACIERLHRRKSLSYYIGAMLSRRTAALRLIPRSVGPDDIQPYLEALGFSAPAARPAFDALQSVLAMGGMAFPAVDVDEELQPNLGLECFLRKRPWAPLLDWLVSVGVCDAAKRDALLRFNRLVRQSAQPHAWSPTFAALAEFLPGHEPCIRRSLSHIKLSFREGRLLEAKAYLEVAFFWFSGRAEPSAAR